MSVLDSLLDAEKVLNSFIKNNENIEKINATINLMASCFKNGGKIYSCGNGGSMSDAMHFAEELTGKFRDNRIPLPAMAISDPTHLTCVANDFNYEFVFSRFIEAWGKQNDILVALSTSGNSKNILNAAETAKSKGMKVIGLSGKGGGKLSTIADIPIIIDSKISDRIQEMHIKCLHIFIEGIERQLFPENYRQ